MSSDTDRLQTIIDSAPERVGVHALTIELLPGDYIFDRPVRIDKPVRIVGKNTRIRLTEPNITAFDIQQNATGARFERLNFLGYTSREGAEIPPHYNLAKSGGTALDVTAGRVVIEHCWFTYLRIGIFLHSNPEPTDFEDPNSYPTELIGNADGCTVRDCDIHHCIYGVWFLGRDAQVGSVSNCRIATCKRGITDQSAFGNHYVSNYINGGEGRGTELPESWGVRVPDFPSGVNSCTFTGCFLESGTGVELNNNCLVLGGNMPAFVHQGERVGVSHSALVFRSQRGQIVTRALVGGAPASRNIRGIPEDAPPELVFLMRQRLPEDGITFSPDAYKVFSYRDEDQQWKLRDRP